MNTASLNFLLLIPVLFIILSIFIVFFLCKFYLRRTKVISYPVAGMDWDKVVYTMSVLLGCFIILSAVIEPAFQSYKVYLSQRQTAAMIISAFSLQYSKLFLISLVGLVLNSTFIKSFQMLLRFKSKDDKMQDEFSLPFSIILASVSIGTAFIIKLVVSEILLTIIPFVINYSVL